MIKDYSLIEVSRKTSTIEFNPKFDKTNKTEVISIENLLAIENIDEIIKSFYNLTGLGVAVFSANHKVLIKHGWQKICTNFHKKNEKASKSCTESDFFFQKNNYPNQVLSYKCSNGLWDIAFPFYTNDIFVGSIHFGQCFFDNDVIDKFFFIKQAKKYKFNENQYINSLKEVPILNYEKVLAGIELLIKVIEKLIR